MTTITTTTAPDGTETVAIPGEMIELEGFTLADLIPAKARTWTYAVLAAVQPATTALAVAVESARVPLAIASGVLAAAGFGVALVHRPA